MVDRIEIVKWKQFLRWHHHLQSLQHWQRSLVEVIVVVGNGLVVARLPQNPLPGERKDIFII